MGIAYESPLWRTLVRVTIEDRGPCGDYTRKVMIEDSTIVTMADLVDLFCSISLALGYHPDTVNSYLRPEEIDE